MGEHIFYLMSRNVDQYDSREVSRDFRRQDVQEHF